MGSVIGMFKKLVGSTSSIMKVLGGALLLVGGVAIVALSKNDTENLIEGTTTLELPEDDVDVIDITENVEIEETVTE